MIRRRTDHRHLRRRLAALILAALLVTSPAAAVAMPIYEPAAPGGATVPMAPPDGAPVDPHLAFGFGSEALAFPKCWRVAGGRRCRHAVIRSFADRPGTRTVPCCHKVLVGGRLTDRAGHPLAGQVVDVIETYARGARYPRRVTPVATDAAGFFRAWLDAGPSRRIAAEFLGSGQTGPANGRRLRLRVRAGVQMQVSTAKVEVGGAPVVFRGSIVHPEGRVPPTGLMVALEFRLPGHRWEQFRVLQTRSGRFSYPYTFEDDDSAGARFLFRAYVPATGNWPFAPATSEPRAVTG
ncbi:MAG TPA: hypothetical protein VHS74_06740 [Solirubrobacterales bacterium]|nr:hypothetical protein [Solirubrobacterales bacterium]